ncbi:MAG TPA: hypothetical protein PK095_13955, partial [Myxococcota bacterium]|nr:hypothetical protein [Myxococcota bacterium]
PDGPHREPTWAPLVTCANGAAKVHKAAAASVNGRAQKAAPVAPVFSHAPWIDGRFEAARSTTGEVTFEVTAEHLRVLRGDTVVDQVAWTPSTRPSLTPKESAHVEIYRLGKGWLAVIGYRASPLGTASPTRWVKLGLGRDSSLDPTPLATDKSLLAHCPVPDDEDGLPACPATYETLTPYLAHYCAGTLTQGHLAAIAQLARGLDLEIALTADALVALFNMHGAMYGYAFKQKNLGAFFYGPPQHLPEACRPLVKRYGRVSDVPATFDEGRDVARRLWKDRAAR